MKLFAFLLLIAALLQTSFVPLNLCLILLICRSYAIHSQDNYYLAFLAGIFLGILSPANLGFWPLLFLLSVLIIHILRLVPIIHNTLIIIPIALSVLLTVSFIESLVFKVPFFWWYPLTSGIISLPIFIIVREWEERFVAKSGIKLKV